MVTMVGIMVVIIMAVIITLSSIPGTGIKLIITITAGTDPIPCPTTEPGVIMELDPQIVRVQEHPIVRLLERPIDHQPERPTVHLQGHLTAHQRQHVHPHQTIPGHRRRVGEAAA